MMDVKQVIVVRKDLNMRKGKVGAQVAHASMGALLKFRDHTVPGFSLKLTPAAQYWLDHSFTKICVYVNSEQELLELHKKAEDLGIANCLIIDNGKTEFNGVPTTTCLALGPCESADVDLVTGGLPLF